MQTKIDAIAAFCNKLAHQLSKKELKTNQNHIQNDLPPPYISIQIPQQTYPLKYQASPTTKTQSSALAPSELALEMVQSALKISSLYQTRNRLTLNFPAQKEKQIVKIEQQAQNDLFPYSIDDFDTNSKMDKKCLKKVMGYLKTSPLQTTRVLTKLKIDEDEWRQWLLIKERMDRRLQLKEQILKRSATAQITMNEFKRLARRIYTHKLFRPTDNWCLNFIRKHKIQDSVNFPIDE